jgi:hypothetical protein
MACDIAVSRNKNLLVAVADQVPIGRSIMATQMPGPVPYLIFAVEDNLAAVTGNACVFHDLFFSLEFSSSAKVF